jgi:hypothetical protein
MVITAAMPRVIHCFTDVVVLFPSDFSFQYPSVKNICPVAAVRFVVELISDVVVVTASKIVIDLEPDVVVVFDPDIMVAPTPEVVVVTTPDTKTDSAGWHKAGQLFIQSGYNSVRRQLKHAGR